MTQLFVAFLYKYLAPFLSGACMASAAVVGDVPTVLALMAAACAFAFAGFPAGGRAMKRMAGV
jgi:hypothetical protein